MKKLLILFLMAAVTISCGTSTQKKQKEEDTMSLAQESQRAFLNNLASLCGKSFGGREVYMQEGRESWSHKKFVMHVTVCEKDKVHIPFHLDNDRSRTWEFTMEEGGLRFRHNHRHEDGTPEDRNLYGGYANGAGTEFMQCFPWDNYTIETLADGIERQWNVILSEDLNSLTYQLLYSGVVVFEAEFDLTKPI